MKTMARAEDKAGIIRRLKTVRPECTRRWGRMSAHQMVCHLSDAFRLVTHQKAASPATGLLQATVVKWIALYVSTLMAGRSPYATGNGSGSRRHSTRRLRSRSRRARGPSRGRQHTAAGYDWPAHPIFGSDVRGSVASVGLPSRGSPPSAVRPLEQPPLAHSQKYGRGMRFLTLAYTRMRLPRPLRSPIHTGRFVAGTSSAV